MRTILITTLVAILAPLADRADAAPPPSSSRVTVSLNGGQTADGSLRLALYDSEAAYDAGAAPYRAAAIPATGPRSVVFEGLAPGRYAIRAYHDRNDNGRLDVNGLGVPQEPYGFSNNARGLMGPAKWRDAAFTAAAGEVAQTLTLR